MADEQSVTVAARTMDEARRKAAYQLGVDANEVELRVAGARRGGLLGLGAPDIVVEAWRAAPNEPAGAPHSQAEIAANVLVAPVQPAPAELPPSEAAPLVPTRPRWLVWSEAGDCMFRTSGRGVILSEVEDAVADWPFDEYFGDGLRAAITQANNANVMIGRIAPPPDLTAETTFFLKIPTDAMSAWAVPGHQPFDHVMNAAELLAALAQKGVTYGIDRQAIQALDGHKLTRPTCVARGFDGSPSRDSAVEFLFPEEDPDVVLRPLIRDDGSVDYRDLIRLHTVPSGTVLGHYLPATAGEPRRDVLNRETPNKMGTQIPPHRFAGPNVALASNGVDYIASKAGRPLREKGRIEVLEVYAIQGDVDFSTGNVDFKGEVYVGGDVKPGFTVRASGSVQVGGLVDEANIEAGRDVLIQGGISGHGHSSIVCGGELSARFIDSAEVVAEKDIMVASQIVRGTISSRGRVTVLGRGSIVGGRVKAARGIICNSSGSASGVPTSLEIDWLQLVKAGDDVSRFLSAAVVIRGDAFAGTTITVNGAKFPLRESMRGVQFSGADRGVSLVQLH